MGSFRLYEPTVLRRITPTISRGYVVQMEVMVRARALGYTFITFVDCIFGESNSGAEEILQYTKGVWTLS